MISLFKFKSLKNIEHTLDIFLNERLHCAEYTELNDPFEGLFCQIFIGAFSNEFSNEFEVYKKVIRKITDNLKICSLSRSLEDVRMWSFYADAHRGIVIEVDFSNFKKDCKKIGYLKGLPKFKSNPDPFKVLTKKTKHWEYESEYRIIQKEEYYPIKGRIKAVYIGNRIEYNDVYLKILNKIIPQEIPIFKTNLDVNEIKIKPGKQLER